MNESYEKKLEAWAEASLRQLPERPAPAELSGRVWAAVREWEGRPWWRRAWPEWPRRWQMLFIVVSAGLMVMAVIYGTYWVQHWGQVVTREASTTLSPWLKPLGVWWDGVRAMGLAGWRAGRAVEPFWWWVGSGILGTMYLSCLGAGFAVYRVVNRASVD